MRKKETVSLCLIVKNEEEFILSCINSVNHLVDEIVVVDTGSCDETPKLAHKAGARVYNFTWNGDFAQARNFALEQAVSDWVLVLDADEVLEPISIEDFNLLLCAQEIEGYFLHIKSYLETEKEVAWDQVVRLFRNKPNYRFKGAIHEQVASSILDANGGRGLMVAPLVINHYGYLKSQLLKKDKTNRNTWIINKALENNPEDPFLLYALAIEHYQQERISQGLNCLEKALARMHGTEGYFEDVLLNISFGLLILGRHRKLIDFIDKSLKMIPQQPDLLLLRGIAYLITGEYRKAVEDLEKILKIRDNKMLCDCLVDYISLTAKEIYTCVAVIEKGYDYPYFPARKSLSHLIENLLSLFTAEIGLNSYPNGITDKNKR